MSKLLVVFGVTGQQGGSLINTVLNDPDLSNEYTLRAIARDTIKPAAQNFLHRNKAKKKKKKEHRTRHSRRRLTRLPPHRIDSGKYVGAILANPDAYTGKALCAATGLYSYSHCVEIITRVTGKKTIFTQIPQEQWSSYLPLESSGPLTAMMRYIWSTGYYGPRREELVEWTGQQARGRLTTFEEFVERHAKDMFT